MVFQNRTAIDRLLAIGTGPESKPWVVQELLHTTNIKNTFAFSVAEDLDIANLLYPSLIHPEVLILGFNLPESRQLEQRKTICQYSVICEDTVLQNSLSETAEESKEAVRTKNVGAFAHILLDVNEAKRVPLMKFVVEKLFASSKIDIVNGDLLSTSTTHASRNGRLFEA